MNCSKRINLNSVLHLKLKGRSSKRKHFRDISQRGSAYAVPCNVMVSDYSFSIALYGLKVVTPPIHTSHHLNFFKTWAYYVLTEHERDPVIS